VDTVDRAEVLGPGRGDRPHPTWRRPPGL